MSNGGGEGISRGKHAHMEKTHPFLISTVSPVQSQIQNQEDVRNGVITRRIHSLRLRHWSAVRPDHFTPQKKGTVPFTNPPHIPTKFYSHL